MSGPRFNLKENPSRNNSLERNRKKEGQCRIYGHTAGKIRAGHSLFCSVCGKRFSSTS